MVSLVASLKYVPGTLTPLNMYCRVACRVHYLLLHSLTDVDNMTDFGERRVATSPFKSSTWENATVPYVFEKGLRKSIL